MNLKRAFTLIELLVVIAVIGILAALVFPAFSISKAKARRAVCINNLQQINLGVRMYSDDSQDALPSQASLVSTNGVIPLYAGYKELMKGYVGLKGASSSRYRLFACPADAFYPSYLSSSSASNVYVYVRQSLHETPVFDFSSYAFNGGDNKTRTSEAGPWTPLGLTGLKLTSVKHPVRTVLVAEAAAMVPWSWHDPSKAPDALPYNDAKDVASYVDGHVSYIKIYWNNARFPNGGISFAFTYDPPDGYDYQWSGN